MYLLASHVSYSEDLMDSPLLLPTNFSGFQVPVSFSNILSKAILKRACQPVVSSTPVPGPSQQVPSASVPVPGPSQPAPSASGPGQSQPVPSGSSFQIPADLIFPSAHAASFAASYNPSADADDEKLLDVEDGAADADASCTKTVVEL